jgi:hypothetical protein
MVTAGEIAQNWQISLVTVRTRQGGCFGSLLYSLVADPRSLTLVVAGINEAVVAVRYSSSDCQILATMVPPVSTTTPAPPAVTRPTLPDPAVYTATPVTISNHPVQHFPCYTVISITKISGAVTYVIIDQTFPTTQFRVHVQITP